MRLLEFILFAFAVFFTPTSSIAHKRADHVIKTHLHLLNITKRSLKAPGVNTVDGVGKEERVNIQIPGLSKIAEVALMVTPRSQNWAQSMWLKAGTNPKDVFNALNLRGTVLKLDDNPRVLQWFKYAKAYRKSAPFLDDDIYQLLSKNMDNGELAVLFYSLKRNPDFESLGERMRWVVFNEWLRNEVHPNKVKIQLELVGNRASDLPDYTLRSKIYDDYAIEFVNYLNLQAYRAHLGELIGGKTYRG